MPKSTTAQHNLSDIQKEGGNQRMNRKAEQLGDRETLPTIIIFKGSLRMEWLAQKFDGILSMVRLPNSVLEVKKVKAAGIHPKKIQEHPLVEVQG